MQQSGATAFTRLIPFLGIISVIAGGSGGGLAEPGTSGSVQDAKTVVENIQRSHELISNVRIVSSWTCRFRGLSNTWEEQTFIRDDLGRRRLITESGPISADGKNQPAAERYVTDTIYNGEVVAYSQYYPGRNRIGAVAARGEPAGYNPVIIGDSSAPLRKELEGHRNPFEYLRNVAVRDLNEALKANRVSQVAEDPPGTVNLRVEYERPAATEKAYSIIAVAPKKNWSIESLKSFTADGVQTQEIVYEYKKQADGLWVPEKGHHVRWGTGSREKGQEAFHWAFQVQEVAYNDPEFDESIFDIKLPADAAVSDTRYDVAYRIGDKEAYSADLEKLADRARQEAERERVAREKSQEFEPKNGRWRSLFILINVIILMAVIGIYAYRRKSNMSAGKAT